MFIGDIRAIRSAGSNRDFVEACRFLIKDSPYVQYIPEKAPDLSDSLDKYYRVSLCENWLRENNYSLKGKFYDFLFASAMNGGYYYKNSPDSKVEKWNKDGSGSFALNMWIQELQNKKLLPGVDHSDIPGNNYGYYQELLSTMSEIPYTDERLEIIRSFSRGGPLYAACHILDSLEVNDIGVFSGHFDMQAVQTLARCFPKAFGEDPFRKKATLAISLITRNLVANGHCISADVPVPADYQMPRIMQYFGVLAFSERLQKAIAQERLLDPTTEAVMHARAATIVAVQDIADTFNTTAWKIDDFLFNEFRSSSILKNPNAPKKMRVYGLWF